jgi:hypothetical protein
VKREAAVNERRQALDAAMHQVDEIADPQTDAAIRIVAWISGGVVLKIVTRGEDNEDKLAA